MINYCLGVKKRILEEGYLLPSSFPTKAIERLFNLFEHLSTQADICMCVVSTVVYLELQAPSVFKSVRCSAHILLPANVNNYMQDL